MTEAVMMLRERGEFQRFFVHRIWRRGVSNASTASLIFFAFGDWSHGEAEDAVQDDESESSVTVLVFILAFAFVASVQTVRASRGDA